MTSFRLGLVLLFIASSLCGFIVYEEPGKLLEEGESYHLKLSLITPEDSVIGNKKTSLAITQTLYAEKETPGRVEVLVYHSERESSIGALDSKGDTIYCCSEELLGLGACDSVGSVITNGEEHIQTIVADFKGTNRASIDESYESIGTSGVYYIKYFNCPGSDVGDVRIVGEVHFVNPFGNLSANLYPFIYFFALMTIIYMVLGLIWIGLSAIYWDRLLNLQLCIAGVIFLGMVECVTWYFDFLSFNITGNFNVFAIVVGVFTSTTKRTVSRLLVLAVAMGYGVVKATLGSDGKKITYLGICYFIVSFSQQLLLTYLREGDNPLAAFIASMMVFPSAVLDTLFYWWIFLSLMRTISQLKARKQEEKLAMYTDFFILLAVAGVLTILVILLQCLLSITSSQDEMWSFWWMFTAFWDFLYFFVLCSIAFVWRPTSNNTRYAYKASEDIDLFKEDAEGNIDTGNELHFDLDQFSKSFLDDEEEQKEQQSKME